MASRRQKSAQGFARDIADDLLSEIEVQYNQLVKETITDLTFGVNGRYLRPVLTGFFASSWKASTKDIRAVDARENFSPWSKLRTVYDSKSRRTVLAPGQQPKLKIRHYVPRKFRVTDSVGIGNTAEYTLEALQSNKSKLIDYILGAGGLDEKINRIFTDKNRPTTTIQGGSFEGGGISQDL